LRRSQAGDPLEFTAQWNDDIHHVLHTAATFENHSYYRDYIAKKDLLGRAMAEGFAYQGQKMECIGRKRGQPSAQLPPAAFVAFIQNHDQVGNRAFGDRITTIASCEAVHAIAAAYLLLPQIPMLFMGEEWDSRRPFTFFCDFPGELGESVRNGRRAEFAALPEFQNPEQRERIPTQAHTTLFSPRSWRGKNWNSLNTPHGLTGTSVFFRSGGSNWFRSSVRSAPMQASSRSLRTEQCASAGKWARSCNSP
jgi:maltooligosyltrehalose trehalohydrolase